jgi:hypothetical protein
MPKTVVNASITITKGKAIAMEMAIATNPRVITAKIMVTAMEKTKATTMTTQSVVRI